MSDAPVVRRLAADDDDGIRLVAARMGETLVEVLGQERGGSMYTPEWLVARVQFHLDPARCTGAVFVAEGRDGALVGHTIVRVEQDGQAVHGLFSTTWVLPAVRGTGIAHALLERGERWMAAQGMATAVTYTDPHNVPLIELYAGRGYAQVPVSDEFVRLERALEGEVNPGRTPAGG